MGLMCNMKVSFGARPAASVNHTLREKRNSIITLIPAEFHQTFSCSFKEYEQMFFVDIFLKKHHLVYFSSLLLLVCLFFSHY